MKILPASLAHFQNNVVHGLLESLNFDRNGIRPNRQCWEKVITGSICFLCKSHIGRWVLYRYGCVSNHCATWISNQSSETRVLHLSQRRSTQRNTDQTNSERQRKPPHPRHQPSFI